MNYLITIKKITLRVLLAIIIAVALLTVVYSIPVDRMDDNITSSAVIIGDEGVYPSLFSWCTSTLDNFTDSVMLLHAGYKGEHPPIFEAMKVHRGFISYSLPNDTLVNHYLNGQDFSYADSYARYWHGYLVFLKPLLVFTDISGIRIINTVWQILLTVFLVFAMCRANLKEYILPYLISLFFIMPLALFKSMMFSNCFNVFTLSSLAIILNHQYSCNESADSYIFLYTGIATAFFDLLSYPQTTFGIPLIFSLLLSEEKTSAKQFLLATKNGIYWLSGYSLMWIGKWISSTIITGENGFIRAVDGMLDNASHDPIPAMLYGNIRDFLYTPVSIVAIIFVSLMIINICRSKKKLFDSEKLILLLASLLPFCCYFVLQHHSFVHHFFTNKELMVSSFAILAYLSSIAFKNENEQTVQ